MADVKRLPVHQFSVVIFHGVQRRMVSVVNFVRIFEIIIFCFAVAVCGLVHAVEAMYGLS